MYPPPSMCSMDNLNINTIKATGPTSITNMNEIFIAQSDNNKVISMTMNLDEIFITQSDNNEVTGLTHRPFDPRVDTQSECIRPNDGRNKYIRSGGESNPGPVLSTLGGVANRTARAAFRTMFPQYAEWYSTMQNLTANLKDYGYLTLNLIRLYTSFIDCVSTFLYRLSAITSMDLYTRLIILCVNIYEVLSLMFGKMGFEIVTPSPTARPQAGPLETFCLATMLSAMLPKQLHGLIKDIPTFSNFKLLDDATWIFDIFSFAVSLPRKICGLLLSKNEKTQFVFDTLTRVEEFLPFSSLSKHHFELKQVLDEVTKKPSLIGDKAFQDRVLTLHKTYTNYKATFLEDRRELPPYMQDHDKRFRNLVNKVSYMKSSLRVEPIAVIFSGSRGTGKTTLMNMLLQAYSKNNSVYTHMSQMDKDFHDQYDNEDIYVVDDIGQKGVWQWSGLINFVSTSQCPLLCADAEKKSTKFFTSKMFFGTTNRINLTLTADCGITDLPALHRRLTNFDFREVTFLDGQFAGKLYIQEYDLLQSKFRDVQVLEAENGKFDLSTIDAFLRTKLEKKMANMKQFDHGITFQALPQSLGEQVVLKLNDVREYFNSLFRNMSEFDYDSIIEPIKADINWKVYCAKDCAKVTAASVVSNISTPVVILSALVGAIMYGIYECFNTIMEYQSTKVPTRTRDIHYQAADRKKISIRLATPQSMEKLFREPDNLIDIPQLRKISSQTVVVQADFVRSRKQIVTYFSSVISGRYLTAPMHALNLEVGDELYVTVHKSLNSIYYDKIKCRIHYVNFKDDIAIIQIPLFLPKYFQNLKFATDSSVYDLVLSTPAGIQELKGSVTQLDCRITYKQFDTGYHGTLAPKECTLYEEQEDGICGSMLLTRDGYPLGHHVAMVSGDDSYGCAKFFSTKTIDKLTELFSEKIDYEVIAAKKLAVGSIVKIDAKEFHHIPIVSKYSPSLVSGIFPIERAPANLNVFGRDTVKVFSEKSRQPVASLDQQSLEYATDYIEELLPEADVLGSEKILILGDGDGINRINPDTSVGHGLVGTKHHYLDYDEGKLRSNIKGEVKTFCTQVCDGSYKFDTYYAETLKDELKNIEKVNKPRVFKAGPLVLTLLYRFFFCDLLAKVSKKRLENGIMVGLNPLGEEWDKFARQLSGFSTEFFDGDWKFWDGGMLTQAQQEVCRIMKLKVHKPKDYVKFNNVFHTNLSAEEYEKVFDMSLVLLYMTPTITLDEVFITTHSMPSGCALTAFFNSVVNKSYGAYIFNVLYKRKHGVEAPMDAYRKSVFDCVYGDDKVTAVKNSVAPWYNGRAFSGIAREMGLDFTPADKGEWTYNTRSLFDCSFLKRGFRVHSHIGKIVAPLERVSMTGTLNFVSDDFRNDELTKTKLMNFQREAFLHEDYENLMERIKICNNLVPVTFLSTKYLTKLYSSGDYGDYLELS